jgi:hypothetical protein
VRARKKDESLVLEASILACVTPMLEEELDLSELDIKALIIAISLNDVRP